MYIKLISALLILVTMYIDCIAQQTLFPYFYSLDYDKKYLKGVDLDSLFIYTPNLKKFGFIEEKHHKERLQIPNSFCELDSLEYVEIAVKDITLPSCISNMSKLVYFNLYAENVHNTNNVFDNTSHMDSLRTFRVTARGYIDSSIFKSVSQMPRVEDVYLNLPDLVYVPEVIGNTDSVYNLAIVSNECLTLPITMSKLKKLRSFSFNVDWTNDENFIVLSKLPNLKYLGDEKGTYSQQISFNLTLLSKLEELDINTDFSDENNISVLSQLPNLKVLSIEVKAFTKSRIASNINLIKDIDRIVLFPKGVCNVLKAYKMKKKLKKFLNEDVQIRVVY